MTRTAAAMLAFLAAAESAALQPRLVESRHASGPAVAVAEMRPPVAGVDAAWVLQRHVDAVARAGGGTVFLHAGTYSFMTPLVIREGVTVRGDSPRGGAPGDGTLLRIEHGHGSEAGPPAITMERGTGLRSVAVWHPRQSVTNPVPYPWTLATSPTVTGNNVSLLDVTLVNPWRGIRIGPAWNELHYLRHVRMAPLRAGIEIDDTTDVGRVVDVVMSPDVWTGSGLPGAPERLALRDAMRATLTGLDVGRTDWGYFDGVRVVDARVGIRFRRGERGASNAVLYECVANGAEAGLALDAMNLIGLAATRCAFGGAGHALTVSTDASVAQFNTCLFGGARTPRIVLDGRGVTTFQNCRMGPGAGAVAVRRGSVALAACEVAGDIVLDEPVRRGLFLGNALLEGASLHYEQVAGDVQVLHAAPERPSWARPLGFEPPPRPERAPRSHAQAARLVDAAAHGVSPANPDNTAALQAALDHAAGLGAIVYVAAGRYRFAGSVTVPGGVELRGSWDVPHHTISGGTMLLAEGGRGNEDGAPFIALEPGAAARGLTVWYPGQDPFNPVPYPWTFRALGADCALVDVTVGNGWQVADFWTRPVDRHHIRYLAGAPFRRGLWVSQSRDGLVEDVHFNPHYAVRRPWDLPVPWSDPAAASDALIAFQRQNLEAFVFGACVNQRVERTFVYAAREGIAFRAGGTSGTVLMHGSDTGQHPLVLEQAGENGLTFINTQLVPMSEEPSTGIAAGPDFTGDARFFNTQLWFGDTAARIAGNGRVLFEQMNAISGAVEVLGGEVLTENLVAVPVNRPQVRVDAAARARVTASQHVEHPLRLAGVEGGNAAANGWRTALDPPDAPGRFATGWERGDPAPEDGHAVSDSGRLRALAARGPSKSGRRALYVSGRLAGVDSVRVVEGPWLLFPGSVLRYAFLPENEAGRHIQVDLLLADGSTLAETWARTAGDVAANPRAPKGAVGDWTVVTIPAGVYLEGAAVEALLVSAAPPPGAYAAAYIDDVRLTSRDKAAHYRIPAMPRGGSHVGPVAVTLAVPDGLRVRYTLDGTAPTPQSAAYHAPISLDGPGLYTLRYAATRQNGEPSSVVLGQTYELR